MEINAPAYKGIKKYKDGDNAALRKVIMNATPIAAEQMCQFAEQFRGKTELETCRNIWNFLKHKIKYVADQEYQIVRLPSALLKTKVGDCKSYSVFTSAVLQCLGIPHHYMMTSYRKDNPTPSHIYVTTDSGIIIDAVWHSFNSEKPYAYVYKIKPYKTMKNNSTGLGGTALPPFKVGIGAIPTFRVGMGELYSQNDTMMGASNCRCGCNGNCGCGVGAITKKQVNAPLRTLILLFFKANIGGFATKFQEAGIGDDKLGRWFTELGGDGRELWAAIKEGSSKPVIAKWFSNSIRNKIVKQLRKIEAEKKGIAGIGQSEVENPQAETSELPNNTEIQNSDDIVAAVMQGDYMVALRLLCISLGGAAANLIPACNVDPSQFVRAACTTGGGILGNVFFALMKEFIRVLFPKTKTPPKLEWSTLKTAIDKGISLEGRPITDMAKKVCNSALYKSNPNIAVDNIKCSEILRILNSGGTTYDSQAISASLFPLYYAAGNVSDTLQSQMAEYLRGLGKAKDIVEFYDKAQAEKAADLPPLDDNGQPKQAGMGFALVAIGIVAYFAMVGKKGVKGARR